MEKRKVLFCYISETTEQQMDKGNVLFLCETECFALNRRKTCNAKLRCIYIRMYGELNLLNQNGKQQFFFLKMKIKTILRYHKHRLAFVIEFSIRFIKRHLVAFISYATLFMQIIHIFAIYFNNTGEKNWIKNCWAI